MPGPVIYLVRSWPRLSQTFILDEVLALERRGLDLVLFSLVRSGEAIVHPDVAGVRTPVHFLDEPRPRLARRIAAHLTVAAHAPRRYLAACWFAARNPALSSGYATCSTRRCLGHAVQVAAATVRMRRYGRRPAHVHAHFAHDPALVALLVRRLTGLPYSLTAHARDLYQIPAASLSARTAEATTVVTCCEVNAAYIAATVPAAQRPEVRVVHHGVQLDRFIPPPARPAGAVPTLVSIGRLVEKKGFEDLLLALARVKAAGYPFALRVYGDGPLRERLEARRDELGLAADVRFMGPRGRLDVVEALAGADVFVLTPRETGDGDRDGIPNVLVEAMASGLAVVTTSAGGITELVDDGVNGLVAEPGDDAAVAAHLRRLLDDAVLRRELATAGRRTVEAGYDVDAAADALDRIFLPRPIAVGGP